jgi:hypothetical protein
MLHPLLAVGLFLIEFRFLLVVEHGVNLGIRVGAQLLEFLAHSLAVTAAGVVVPEIVHFLLLIDQDRLDLGLLVGGKV